MQGSLDNRLYEGNQYGDLVVGMGATEMAYSDRHAYTVQKVISDNRVIVTKDESIRSSQILHNCILPIRGCVCPL